MNKKTMAVSFLVVPEMHQQPRLTDKQGPFRSVSSQHGSRRPPPAPQPSKLWHPNGPPCIFPSSKWLLGAVPVSIESSNDSRDNGHADSILKSFSNTQNSRSLPFWNSAGARRRNHTIRQRRENQSPSLVMKSSTTITTDRNLSNASANNPLATTKVKFQAIRKIIATAWTTSLQHQIIFGIPTLLPSTILTTSPSLANTIAEWTKKAVVSAPPPPTLPPLPPTQNVIQAVAAAGRVLSGPRLAKAAVTLLIAWIVARIKRRWMARFMKSRIGRIDHLSFYNLVLNLGIGSVVTLIFLTLFPIPEASGAGIRSIFAASGLGAVIFGIASRNLAEQTVSGLVIAATNMYQEGDRIRLPESNGGCCLEGIVIRMTLLDTHVRGDDYAVYQIPNSKIVNHYVMNLSRITQSRVQETIRIQYGDMLGKVPELVHEAIPKQILALSPPLVCAKINQGSNLDHQEVSNTGQGKQRQQPRRRPLLRAYLSSLQRDHVEIIVTCDLHCRPGSVAFIHWRQEILLAIAQAVQDMGAEFAMPTAVSVNRKRRGGGGGGGAGGGSAGQIMSMVSNAISGTSNDSSSATRRMTTTTTTNNHNNNNNKSAEKMQVVDQELSLKIKNATNNKDDNVHDDPIKSDDDDDDDDDKNNNVSDKDIPNIPRTSNKENAQQ